MADPIYAIVARLPLKLQNRIASLGSYVRSVVEEYQDEIGLKPRERLSRSQVQTIQGACIVYFLLNFFREGSRAARSAVSASEGFGLKGVSIGATVFEGENANVTRGDRLADDLERLLAGTAIASRLRRASSLRFLIEQLVREASNEKTMGRT